MNFPKHGPVGAQVCQCPCGHAIIRCYSEVDGRELWFHGEPGCLCREKPGCGAPPKEPPALVGASRNGQPSDPSSAAGLPEQLS